MFDTVEAPHMQFDTRNIVFDVNNAHHMHQISNQSSSGSTGLAHGTIESTRLVDLAPPMLYIVLALANRHVSTVIVTIGPTRGGPTDPNTLVGHVESIVSTTNVVYFNHTLPNNIISGANGQSACTVDTHRESRAGHSGISFSLIN